MSSSAANQLVTEGPTIDGSANINNLASATGSGNATFASLITSGSSIGSVQFFNSGSTFSTTLTPAAAPTSNFTLNLPDVEANDTLAGLGFAQTLSNKTLKNALFVDGTHSNATLFSTSGVAGAVNYFQIGNAASGNRVSLSALGTGSPVPATVASQGYASVYLNSNGAPALAATNASATAVNYASIVGSIAGKGITYGAAGSDTDINVALTPKGAGYVAVQSSIRTASGMNSDLAGQLTIATGGTKSYPFTGSYITAPICVATDTSTKSALEIAVTTSMLTISGPVGDAVNYICIGRT